MLETLAALVKLLLYVAAMCAAGTTLAAASLRRHLGEVANLASSVIASAAAGVVLASAIHIVVLLMRLGGDFSGPTLSAVLGTSVGLAAGLQVAGALLLLVAARASHSGWLLSVAGAVAILASFGVSGHASAVDVTSGVVAFVHVSAAAWWAGALLLLRPACAHLESHALFGLVRVFSRYAMAIVAALVGAGFWLILVLVDFSTPNWFTPYAQNLALKIGLAAGVLGVAAYNKLRLTSRLANDSGSGARVLRYSITIELLIIGAVLTTTAWLTTFHSPHLNGN